MRSEAARAGAGVRTRVCARRSGSVWVSGGPGARVRGVAAAGREPSGRPRGRRLVFVSEARLGGGLFGSSARSRSGPRGGGGRQVPPRRGGGSRCPPAGRGERVGDRWPPQRGAGRRREAGATRWGVGRGRGRGQEPPRRDLGRGDRTGSLPSGRRERACDGCLLHGERREDPDWRPLRGERREGSGQVRPPRGAGKGAGTAPTSAPGASLGLGGWRPPFLAGQWCE